MTPETALMRIKNRKSSWETGKGKKTTEEVTARVKKVYLSSVASGAPMSYAVIAKRFRLSFNTAKRICKEAGMSHK